MSTITMDSQLQCPHGGQVMIQTSNPVSVNGVPVPTQFDTFTITGCPFQIPAPSGTIPSPCTTVQWVKADLSVKINGIPTLNDQSVGLCLSATQIPQGTVSVVNTQSNVSTR